MAISVDGPGTGDGFVLFCDGETDISDASRAIEDEEVAACADAGIDYVELAVAFDGITVMTNPANSAVDMPEHRRPLRAVRAGVRRLRQLDGRRLARDRSRRQRRLPGRRRSRSRHPGEESGTYDAFIDLAGIEDTALAQGCRGQGRRAAERLPVLAGRQRDHPGDGGLAELARVRRVRVRGAGRATRSRNRRSTAAAAASSPAGHDRRRQLPAVPVAVHLREHRHGAKPALKAFVDYYLSDAGIDGGVGRRLHRAPDDQIDATRTAWDGAEA